MDCFFCVAFKTDALLEKSDLSLPLDILFDMNLFETFLELTFEVFRDWFLDTEFELFFLLDSFLLADLCSTLLIGDPLLILTVFYLETIFDGG
jgi:hypothetical protein